MAIWGDKIFVPWQDRTHIFFQTAAGGGGVTIRVTVKAKGDLPSIIVSSVCGRWLPKMKIAHYHVCLEWLFLLGGGGGRVFSFVCWLVG